MTELHSEPASWASRLKEWRPGGVSKVISKPGRGFCGWGAVPGDDLRLLDSAPAHEKASVDDRPGRR